jgi:PBP1b-binding outer membrane lipoprotein LpoB
MSITSRITTAGTATVIVVLALSGCAGTGTTAPGVERATPRSSAPTQAPTQAPTETPTAPATVDSATKDLTFEDGQETDGAAHEDSA